MNARRVASASVLVIAPKGVCSTMNLDVGLDVEDGEVMQEVGAHREVGEVPSSTERYVGQGVRGACASVLVIGKALDEDRLHLAGARP